MLGSPADDERGERRRGSFWAHLQAELFLLVRAATALKTGPNFRASVLAARRSSRCLFLSRARLALALSLFPCRRRSRCRVYSLSITLFLSLSPSLQEQELGFSTTASRFRLFPALTRALARVCPPIPSPKPAAAPAQPRREDDDEPRGYDPPLGRRVHHSRGGGGGGGGEWRTDEEEEIVEVFGVVDL